jgi:hypothetical protein
MKTSPTLARRCIFCQLLSEWTGDRSQEPGARSQEYSNLRFFNGLTQRFGEKSEYDYEYDFRNEVEGARNESR